jgi:ParB/RepB/Spo0J family partition protein
MPPGRIAISPERWWILARTDFRAAAARRLSEERELSPAIVSLITADSPTRSVGVRIVPVGNIEPNPEQPRLVFNQDTLDELTASVREHGVLQPILVRPLGPNRYQIVAGERRWRASKQAGLETIPALIEDIDDDTALEISIIENLQREDISPLDEAAMYDRMVREHGYSIRKLADKLGKDKGYLENRLRLADAPPEIRELVSLRKDTLSHAYELMKVEDPRKRRRLADQVARGELTLIKLRDKIEGRRSRPARPTGDLVLEVDGTDLHEVLAEIAPATDEPEVWADAPVRLVIGEDSLVNAKHSLAEALDELVGVLRSPEAVRSIADVDRVNLAKYLTIAKLRIENAIAIVRSGDPGT